MLDLFAGLLSFFSQPQDLPSLRSTNWGTFLDAAWVSSLTQPVPMPDANAEAVVRSHLTAVAQITMNVEMQGVWIQTDREILATHQATTPLSAASLTKIPTTLANLVTWGPDHQFETLVNLQGTLQDGVLQGDLVVIGGDDPLFVWEEAIALANALEQAGIRRITGNLIVSDNFVMNFEQDPAIAGQFLRQSLNADTWNQEAVSQYLNLPPGTPKPKIVIEGSVQVKTVTELSELPTQPIVRHLSLPLVDLLKAMNTYSNNVMADLMANSVGGPEVVAQRSADEAGVPVEEIQLINGSGLGMENRISPRAVGAMLTAIQRHSLRHQITIADLFPVIGRNRGTLRRRNIPLGAAVKTGTLNQVSSLAGVIPTRDRGLIWFAIINVGGGDLGLLHQQQDRLLQELTTAWGTPPTLPLELTPHDRRNLEISQFGAISRNEILN